MLHVLDAARGEIVDDEDFVAAIEHRFGEM